MLPVPVAVNNNALFSAAALQRTLPELLETAKHVPPSNPLYRALLGTAFQEAMEAQYFRELANRQTLDPARLTTDEERDADDAAKAGELERRIQAAQSAAVAASERGADSSAALYAGLRAGVAVVVAPRYVGPVVVVGDSMAAREFQKVFDEDARKRRAQVELEAEGADGEEDKASKAKKPRKRAPKDKDAAKAEKLPRKDTRKRPGRKRPPRPSSGAGQLRAEDPITDPRVRVADAQRPSTEAIETYGVTPDGGLAAWRVNAYWAAPRAADRVRAMETAAAQLHEQLRSRLQQLAPCAPATAESTPSDELSMDAWCRALPGGYATVREKRAALEQAVDEAPIAPSTAPGPAEVARARQEGVFPRGHPCAGLPDALLMTPAELAALDAPAYVESIVARFDACYLDLNASTARTHPAHESRSITNNFARCRASLVAHDLHGFVASSPNMGAWRMETPLHECLPAECEVQSGGDASASAPAGPKEPVPARLYAHASAGDLAMALRHPEVLACLSHPLCRPQEQLGEWPVLFALDALGSLAVNPPQRGELVAERHYWRGRATTAPLLAALVAHLSCTPLPTLDKLGEAGAWWLGVGAAHETPTERAVRLHLAHTFVARRAAVALSLRLQPRHWVELERDNAAVQSWGGYISLWLELRLVRLPCMHALAAAWAAYMFDPSMAMYDYAPMSVTYNPPDLTSPEQYALEKARELSRVYHKGEAGRLRALLSSYASTALHRATNDGLEPALEAERRARLLRNAAAAATAEGAAAGELPPAARVVYTSATYDPVSAVWATFQRQACDTLRVPLEPKRIDVRTFAATVWDHRHNTSTLVGDARAPTAETVTLTSYARSYALMRRWNTAKGLPIQFTSMPFRCVANSVTEACVSGAQPAWPPLATYAALALEYAQRLERGLASFAGREISAGEMRGLLSHVERGEEERTRWLVMERNASPYLLYIQTRARYCDGNRGQQKKRRAGDADADEQQEEKDGENQNRSLTADKFAGAAYARPSLTWASRVGVARLLRRWRIVQRASPEGSLPSAVLMSEACTRVANELYDEIAETTYSSMRGYAREMLVKRISADAYRMPAHKGLRRAMCLPVEPVRGADGTTAEEQAEEYEDTDDRWQLVD